MKKFYYIIFQNAEGSFPQRDTESYDKNSVQKEVNRLNNELQKEEKYPWCCYSVGVRN